MDRWLWTGGPKAIALALLAAVWLSSAPKSHAAQPPEGVEVTASIEPRTAFPGTVVDLSLRLTMPKGWIAYDVEQAANAVLPTRIILENSADYAPLETFKAAGALERPEPMFNNRVVRYFEKSPTFRRPLLVAANTTPGEKNISGRIDFQVCNEETGRCYVVRNHPFSAELVISRPQPSIAPASRAKVNPIPQPLAEPPVSPPAPVQIVVEKPILEEAKQPAAVEIAQAPPELPPVSLGLPTAESSEEPSAEPEAVAESNEAIAGTSTPESSEQQARAPAPSAPASEEMTSPGAIQTAQQTVDADADEAMTTPFISFSDSIDNKTLELKSVPQADVEVDFGDFFTQFEVDDPADKLEMWGSPPARSGSSPLLMTALLVGGFAGGWFANRFRSR